MSNFLDLINDPNVSEHQRTVTLATAVKNLAEGPLFMMRNYLFQYLAIQSEFEIEHVNFLYQPNLGEQHVDVGFESNDQAYIRLDAMYKDSGNKTAIDLTFIGIGKILKKNPQLEVQQARSEGINWINRFNAEVFVDLKDNNEEVENKYSEYFANCVYFWLTHNAPQYLTAHESKESFISSFKATFVENKEIKHLDFRLNDTIISTIVNKDKKAIDFFRKYINLITMPPQDGYQIPSSSTAEFMSLYLFHCLE